MLDWWQALVDKFGEVRHSITQPVKTAERMMNWVERQVVQTMCVLSSGMGQKKFVSFMKEKIRYARQNRMSKVHYTIISQLMDEFHTSPDDLPWEMDIFN